MTAASLKCAVLLAVAATVAVGCSSSHVVDGAATREAGHPTGEVVPALLNAGNYPTTPHSPYGVAGDNGGIFEAQRMADFVVGPWEVDPALVEGAINEGVPIASSETFGIAAADKSATPIFDAHGFLLGFLSSRGSAQPDGQLQSLTNGVLRFPDPAEASRAATEVGTPHGAPFPGAGTPVSQAIPGHPDAVATTMTTGDGTAAAVAYEARGPYVLYASAQQRGTDLTVGTQAISRALDLQGPRIDAFTPTAPTQLAALPVDPTGLMARTLPPPKDSRLNVYGTWGPRAALHFESDPIRSAKAFTDAGLTTKTWGLTQVFEAKDAQGAQALLRSMRTAPSTRTLVDGVPGLPAAVCSKDDGADPAQFSVSCDYVVDRYVVQVASQHAFDAQQQAAAQYLLLTAK